MSRWDNITSAATEAATFVEDKAAQAVDFTTKKIDQ
jgi:hypothetical protein